MLSSIMPDMAKFVCYRFGKCCQKRAMTAGFIMNIFTAKKVLLAIRMKFFEVL